MNSTHFSAPQSEALSRPALALALSSFALFGLLFGVWQVALPDLQHELALSPGALGAALTSGFLASLPLMLLGGRLADRWGARTLIAGTALLLALAFLGLLLVGGFWGLVALLLLFFGASGAYDVGINAAAMAIEQRSARRLMAYFHAAFSGAAALGALLTGGLLALGMPFRLGYLVVAAGMLLLAGIIWRSPSLRHATQRAEQAAPPLAGAAPARLYRVPALLLLALITALAFLSEGTLETWSAIYLRSTLNLPASVGALGPAVFHTAMLLGRLSTARLVQRLGRRAVLRLAGLAAAAGMVLALATTIPPLILSGLLVAGLALAGVAPTAFSLAGEVAPDRSGEASSVITVVGYSGFLIGPALIGGLAELAGLRLALATLIGMGALIVLLSTWVREPGLSRH